VQDDKGSRQHSDINRDVEDNKKEEGENDEEEDF
jgi:hypothetical protein